MNVLSDQLRRRIAGLRPDWNTGDVSGFIYLDGGYSNHNYRFEYRGERYVLRAPGQPRPFVDRRLEQDLYADGAAAGMPELVAYDPDTGDMISRWVAGAMLADCRPDGGELVDYLTRLHTHMPPMARVYDPLEQARAHLDHAAAPGWVGQLAAALHWAPEHPTGCHNDLNPWNVIRAPDGRWITLDWEWAGRNDPLFDLVSLHQGLNLADSELPVLASRFLATPPTPARLYRCLVVFWLRETTWAMAEIKAGNQRPEVAEQRRIGLARLQTLAEGMPDPAREAQPP